MIEFRRSVVLLLAVGVLAMHGCDEAPSPAAPASGVKVESIDAPSGESADDQWRRGVTADGTWSVAWRPVGGVIPPLDPFAVEVELQDPAGHAIPENVTVLVDATMPHHGHGMNVEPRIERRDDGRFIAEGMLLHMPGRWEFTVDVLRGDEVERAQWTVMLDD